MGFLTPKIKVPAPIPLEDLRAEVPKPPEKNATRLRIPESGSISQLAARSQGTRQLAGGAVSNLNIPLFN